MHRGLIACASLGLALAASPELSAAPPPPLAWASWTASPLAMEGSLDPLERAALTKCGTGEGGLREVAKVLLARRLEGTPLPDAEGVARVQRSVGEPHPWARAWAMHGRALEPDGVTSALDAWLAGGPPGSHRCGVAAGTAEDGTRALVVVAVDVLADLSPLPTRARTGQWLTVEARLRPGVSSAAVLVLDPGGVPRTIPSWMEGDTLHARFAAPRPGELAMQVLAQGPHGPRPVLEATVFVDVAPSASDAAAPGESLEASTDDERLASMVDAARASAGLLPLIRDARLDRLAHEHAVRMAQVHELAHDAGDGDPFDRLWAAGLDATATAENVAHSTSAPLAHRALWASPSHRMNLLARAVDRMGVGVARDAQGSLWVTETFAGGLR